VHQAHEELYEQGHDQLADIIYQLPNATCNGRHDEAEMLFAQALPLVRDLKHDWLEVYMRHWIAQSRILHRHNVTAGLRDAIDLLEFAHTDAAKQCPQSVCVTQDVCAAYGVADGPGFSEERLAASSETLARIDASWPCFSCISAEHALALYDAGRYQQCRDFCFKQLSELAKHGEGSHSMLGTYAAEAMLKLGQTAQALEMLVRIAPIHGNQNQEHKRSMVEGLALTKLGRHEEAIDKQRTASLITANIYLNWAELELALCHATPSRNTAKLDNTLARFCDELEIGGARFRRAQITQIRTELAAMRGEHQLAAQLLDSVEEQKTGLRKPEYLMLKSNR
jgi:tetratricopeptide (TPR) repeat protein